MKNLPKINEREIIVNEEGMKFYKLIIDFKEKSQLTDIEYLQLLEKEFASTLKYMLRFERHGDYDTPSGLQK